jgi:phospholipid transport system substrate-binding protein
MILERRRLVALIVGAGLWIPSALVRAATDPAVNLIEAFSTALLEARASKGTGAAVRIRRLRPMVDKTFNMPTMAQLVVGATWNGMSAPDRASLLASLSRYTAARLADEFNSFEGQKIVVNPEAPVRGPDKLVRSVLTQPGEAPVTLAYRMRIYDDVWRVIDVYYNGVSQVTTQRSDFASTLQSGGVGALVKRLDAMTAKLS